MLAYIIICLANYSQCVKWKLIGNIVESHRKRTGVESFVTEETLPCSHERYRSKCCLIEKTLPTTTTKEKTKEAPEGSSRSGCDKGV